MIKLYKAQEEYMKQVKPNWLYATECGTGKTIMAIEHHKRYFNDCNILVICPASKRDTQDWQAYLKKYCDHVNYEVISYNVLPKKWKDYKDYFVIADEGHKVSNSTKVWGKSFFQLTKRAKGFIFLTATPFSDYDGCINYLKCMGLVKNKTQFMKDFAITNNYRGFPEIEGWKHEDRIKAMINEISRPLKKSDILELPDQIFKDVSFKASKDYNIIKKDRVLNDEVFDNQMSYMHALRQHTNLKDKLLWLTDFLEGTNENVVIFTNYVREVTEIKRIIKNKEVYIVVGNEKKLPNKNKDLNNTVTLVNYTAGSEGIELTYATICIFFSPTYSYIQYTQAISRIHRIGQNKKTLYYKLITENTIEKDIYKALKFKKDFNFKIWERGR